MMKWYNKQLYPFMVITFHSRKTQIHDNMAQVRTEIIQKIDSQSQITFSIFLSICCRFFFIVIDATGRAL